PFSAAIVRVSGFRCPSKKLGSHISLLAPFASAMRPGLDSEPVQAGKIGKITLLIANRFPIDTHLDTDRECIGNLIALDSFGCSFPFCVELLVHARKNRIYLIGEECDSCKPSVSI